MLYVCTMYACMYVLVGIRRYLGIYVYISVTTCIWYGWMVIHVPIKTAPLATSPERVGRGR